MVHFRLDRPGPRSAGLPKGIVLDAELFGAGLQYMSPIGVRIAETLVALMQMMGASLDGTLRCIVRISEQSVANLFAERDERPAASSTAPELGSCFFGKKTPPFQAHQSVSNLGVCFVITSDKMSQE